MARMRGGGSRRGASLTVRGQSFLTSGAMLLGCGVVLGLGDLVRLGLLLLGLLLVSVLAARRSPSALAVVREVDPAVVVVGQEADVVLRVRNDGRRRTQALVATELLPRGLGDRPRFLLPALAPGEERLLRYPVAPSRRGPLPLGPLVVRVRDTFDLTAHEVAADAPGALLVHPRVEPLAGGAATMPGAGGDGGAAHGLAASGTADLGVRPYRHGDERRRIHWKATARTGELMVRQEERPSRRIAVVLLDSRAASHSGHDEGSTFEWAVAAAASVVAHLESLGFDVCLVSDETADAVRLGEPDAAQVVLARAALGSNDAFARCLHVVDEMTTTGAVVVAVLGTHHDDETALAATRHPSTRRYALVVAPRSDDVAERTARALGRRGWRATIATPDDAVPDAWARLTSSLGRTA